MRITIGQKEMAVLNELNRFEKEANNLNKKPYSEEDKRRIRKICLDNIKRLAVGNGWLLEYRSELSVFIERLQDAVNEDELFFPLAATPQQFDSSVPKCFQNNSKADDLFAMLENTKVIYKGVEQPLLDRKQIPWKPITTASWAYICTITKAQIGGTYNQWEEITKKKNLQQVFQKSGKILFKKEIDAILKGLGYQIT